MSRRILFGSASCTDSRIRAQTPNLRPCHEQAKEKSMTPTLCTRMWRQVMSPLNQGPDLDRRRIRSSRRRLKRLPLSLGFALILLSAGHINSVVAQDRALDRERHGQVFCYEPDEPSPLHLALASTHLPGDILELEPQGALNLRLTNEAPLGGAARIGVSALSSFAATSTRTLRVDVPASTSVTAAIPATSLHLPMENLDFSGHLKITADIEYPDGSSASASLVVFFHPTASGWQLYDQATRDDRFAGGLLNETARRLSREATFAGAEGGSPSGAFIQKANGDSTPPPTVGAADSIRFCIKHTAAYNDNGVGEDYWTTNPASGRQARGAWASVFDATAGLFIFGGYLGDGVGSGDAGCTSWLLVATANRSYVVSVSSYGQVQGNRVEVRHSENGLLQSARVAFDHTRGAGTFNVTVPIAGEDPDPWDPDFSVFNAYQAAAYAIYRHAGGMTGKAYKIYITNSGTSYSSVSGKINVSLSSANKKFKTVHEVAHRLVHLKGIENASNPRLAPDGVVACQQEGRGNHSMRSEEWVGTAVHEGFAHFYAADVFNNHNEYDCKFKYYKPVNGVGNPTVNCESGHTNFPVAFMESTCNAPFQGHGVELDWLRVFWDVHTDTMAGTRPSFTAMVNWMLKAGAWTRSTAYDVLDARAQSEANDLRSNWNNAKAINGVDAAAN